MKKILVCLDADSQPSVFDAVVAVDSDVDHLFRHGGVTPEVVEGLTHGAMFTRGPQELRNTAIFIGGSNVAAAEALLAATTKCFFGPMRVSVLMDANGSNTTAAAAVIAAGRHVELSDDATATIIGTGSVGQRAARMLANEGVRVRVVSRTVEKATAVCESLEAAVSGGKFSPFGSTEQPIAVAIDGAQIVIAAGPAGVEVVSEESLAGCGSVRVAVDLNAVPPLGIGGISVNDKAVVRGRQTHYGAIGVGGSKMKIHKAAIRRLFETNDVVLDADEVYALAKHMEG